MRQYHPILAITLARLREFVRRPEAVFWVYFFPVLMVIVLGVAFRNQKVESFDVDVINGSAAAQIVADLKLEPRLKPRLVDQTEAQQRLRTGKTTLVIDSGESQTVSSLESI